MNFAKLIVRLDSIYVPLLSLAIGHFFSAFSSPIINYDMR